MTLNDLPDASRLWIFATDRKLSAGAATSILGGVDGFLAGWNSHGAPNVARRELREGFFLMIAADEANAPSGCSIDKMFGLIKRMEQDLSISLIDSSLVHFRTASGEIRSVNRDEFRNLAERGEVDGDTTVFDTTISLLSDLRGGKFERRAAESWHAQAFPLSQSVVS